MSYFTWDSSYSVQVQRFDTEHQRLFQIVNQLYDGMKSGRGKDVLQGVLQELVRYTQQHFSEEETVMRQAGYNGLQQQIDEHKRFVTRVNDLSERFKAGSGALSVELLDVLRDWLVNHIGGMDRQYSAFLNAKGIH